MWIDRLCGVGDKHEHVKEMGMWMIMGAIQGAGYGDGLENRRGDGHGANNGHVRCSGGWA